jgi:hypothetical protein
VQVERQITVRVIEVFAGWDHRKPQAKRRGGRGAMTKSFPDGRHFGSGREEGPAGWTAEGGATDSGWSFTKNSPAGWECDF